MSTKIKSWQIVNGKLSPVVDNLIDGQRKEQVDLESWIFDNPEIIGEGILLIGRQVKTASGTLDLIGIDRTGNIVIVELKRDKLPREAIAQVIDYAAVIKDWTLNEFNEISKEQLNYSIEDKLSEKFPDISLENLRINEAQRLIIVGFEIEESLERMISYLAESFGVNLNAVILNYVKSASGDEILNRTSIIPEETETERIKKKKFSIPLSDEPGNYEIDVLKDKWQRYFAEELVTKHRMKDIMLPKILKDKIVTRAQLKQEFINKKIAIDDKSAGSIMSLISIQMGMKKNDFLRQVISYEYPNNPWEKDNYKISEDYKDFLHSFLKGD